MKDLNIIDNKNILVLIGPPGSGKGSLSALLVKHYNWVQLSTGNLCRQHIAEKTEIGHQIDEAIKEGRLIDDALITRMVEKWLMDQADNDNSIILDGFPRSASQAEQLNAILKDKLPDYNLILVKLEVDDSVLIDRLTSRVICENKECQTVYSLAGKMDKVEEHLKCEHCGCALKRRSDDTEDVIKQRLLTYHEHEKDLLDYYKRIDQNIYTVDADLPLEQVLDRVLITIKEAVS